MKIQNIKAIALENLDGFTIDLRTMEMVKSGYAVAYKETQDSFGDSGLTKAYNHAKENNQFIGGWHNSDNDKFYYDSIRIFISLNEATEFGIKQEQIAIYELHTGTEITL